MSTNTTQTPPPPITAPPPVLRRSSTDRMIGGVCGGLGQRYGIDPMVLRVVFVVAVLAGGVGLFAYLALWVLIPDDRSLVTGPLTRSLFPLVIGILLALAAIAGLIGWFGQLGGFAGVVVAAFLLGLVVWVYQQRTSMSSAPGAAVGRSAQPLTTDTTVITPPAGFAYGGTGYAPGTGPTPPPQPPREHSYLGLITLCAALIVGALLAALAAAGAFSVGVVGGLAAVLAVLSVGLLVGAWRGHAKWLVIIALPLALTLGLVGQLVSLAPATSDRSVGVRSWTPTEPTQDLSLGVGEAELDLREWASSGAPAPRAGDVVAAKVGFGQLNVIVPDTWQVVVAARAGAGTINVNGDPVDTPDVSSQFQQILEPRSGTPAGRLRLVLEVDLGEIVITQRPVPTDQSPGRQNQQDPQDRKNPQNSQNTNKENPR